MTQDLSPDRLYEAPEVCDCFVLRDHPHAPASPGRQPVGEMGTGVSGLICVHFLSFCVCFAANHLKSHNF